MIDPIKLRNYSIFIEHVENAFSTRHPALLTKKKIVLVAVKLHMAAVHCSLVNECDGDVSVSTIWKFTGI